MTKRKLKKFKKISTSENLQESVKLCGEVLRELSLDSFVDVVLRNENLVVQDGDFEKTSWVKSFIDGLNHEIKVNHPESYVDACKKISIIPIINAYFLHLFNWRADTLAVKEMTAVELVSASLVRAAEDYLAIGRKARHILEENSVSNVIDMNSAHLIEDSLGNKVHPDSAMSVVFGSVFLVLKSTGFIEQLKRGSAFDFGVFKSPDENQVVKISALNLNAMTWKAFDTMQKDIRHCGRAWNYSDSNQKVPDEFKEHVREHLDIESPTVLRYYEVSAEHRVRQLANEVYFTTYEHLSATKRGGDQGLLNRLSSRYVTERVLSLSLDDEKNKCLGLTLEQWLEGYATLQDFIRENYVEEEALSLLPIKDKDFFKRLLVERGLPSGIAKMFLENITFGVTSIDLYDTPLIKFGDQYMLYGPSLKEALLHELVISNVGRNKEKLSAKGEALENRLFRLFSESGFQPKKIKENRRGEEYQFDLAVKWGAHLFVFECKNRAIPRSPITSRNMSDDYQEHVIQIQRLCSGLEKHPEILEKYFGSNHGITKIVPCLVNGLPLSFDKQLGGVYVTDISSVSRFFTDNEITLHLGSQQRVIYRQWVCGKPCVGDFMFLLNNPFSLRLKMQNLSSHIEHVYIAEGVFVRAKEIFYDEKGTQDVIRFFNELDDYRKALIAEGEYYLQ